MKKFLGGAFGFLITAAVILVMAVTGAGLVATGLGERKLGQAPEVPLHELVEHDGEVVRVRARVTADPVLRSAGGEGLAFQAVTITHEESSGRGDDRTYTTVTDYARTAPEILLAAAGEATVGVLTPGVDLRFVPERASGRTGAGGALPGEAASLLAAAFTGLPERSAADFSVRAIPDGAEVTIHGTVEVVDGVAVLRAPEALPFVITPLPFAEVLKEAGTSAAWNLGLGAALLLGSLAAAGYAVRGRLRARRAAAA